MKCFLGKPTNRRSDSEPHTKGRWNSTPSTHLWEDRRKRQKSLWKVTGSGKTKAVSDKVEGKAQHRKLPLTSTMARRCSHTWKETHTRVQGHCCCFSQQDSRQERDLKASPAKKNWPSGRESDASPFHIVFLSTLMSK